MMKKKEEKNELIMYHCLSNDTQKIQFSHPIKLKSHTQKKMKKRVSQRAHTCNPKQFNSHHN